MSAMPATPLLHVVFGAGQVGPLLAERLASRGHRVRLVRRSDKAVHLDGVQLHRADAADPAAAAEAARGAAVVYHCINPATYTARAWAEELPPIQEALLGAAARAGARLVVLDNLYALGDPKGRPLTEESPLAPTSRKGEIRARLVEAREAAARRGDVRVVTGRASDFYGPGGVGTYFGELFWKPALAGKKVDAIVNPDSPHTYHYIPDVAAGLAALGEDPSAEGTFNLPCQPAESTRALAGRLAQALGRPIALRRIPPLMVKLLGLAVPLLREANEMAYQWERPFVVDDARFRSRYGAQVTPLGEAARSTAAWGVATFGAARPRR